MSEITSEQYGFPWTEAEFLTVLHAYLGHRGEPRHPGVPWVHEIATLLGRTPAAVAMRLENYAAVDPQVSGRVGLKKGGLKVQQYFARYSTGAGELENIARIVLDHQRAGRKPMLFQKPVEIPKAFGHYELLDLLGEGGFGVVFSCVEIESGRAFAMKLLRKDRLAGGDEQFHRFRREIRVLQKLTHPGIIRLFEDNLDADRTDPAYVMELADGSLRSFLEETAMQRRIQGLSPRPAFTPDEAYPIVSAIGDALTALHTGNPRLCHRDLNPNNIFRRFDGSWLLGDFGLAKFLSTTPPSASYVTQRSQSGWGTDYYTAPEQWERFGDTDERADVYSLGVLVWDLLTSRPPPIRFDQLFIPDTLADVVRRATAHDRDDRYQSVPQLMAALETTWPNTPR